MDPRVNHEMICKIIPPSVSSISKQGLTHAIGVSSENVGSKNIHMQIVEIPPGGRAKAHKHAGHESALYALSGTSHVWHGEDLKQHSIVPPGSFVYIPADVPHLPYNPSPTETVVVVASRTDANEQESVVLLPDLEAKVSWQI